MGLAEDYPNCKIEPGYPVFCYGCNTVKSNCDYFQVDWPFGDGRYWHFCADCLVREGFRLPSKREVRKMKISRLRENIRIEKKFLNEYKQELKFLLGENR